MFKDQVIVFCKISYLTKRMLFQKTLKIA